jgi:hypothetical protein
MRFTKKRNAMKKLVITLSAVGMFMAMPGCMHMPTKVERRPGTNQYSNPSRAHDFPPPAKNKANQKH